MNKTLFIVVAELLFFFVIILTFFISFKYYEKKLDISLIELKKKLDENSNEFNKEYEKVMDNLKFTNLSNRKEK